MAEKRKCGQNFSIENKDKIVKLLLQHKNTLLNKKTDGTTNENKNTAWIEITNSYNSSSNTYRTKESLMKLWEKMKSESKIYYNRMRMSTTQTGGGPSTVKIDPVLEQVCAILGRGCTGIDGVPDSDFVETGAEVEPALPKIVCLSNDLIEESKSFQDVTSAEILEIQELQEPKNITSLWSRRRPQLSSCNERSQGQPQNNTFEDLSNEMTDVEEIKVNKSQELQKPTNKTPLWSRRRPQISSCNERSEAVVTVSERISNVYKKKESIEDLKNQLLQEELVFKRKLYDLQLQAAVKDVEIKTAMLNQIKGGGLAQQDKN